jgi:hypothetical protein
MRRIRLSYGMMPVLLFLVAAEAGAQPPEPIARFVVDARGTLARFKEDAAVAAALNVTAKNLPTRGLGLAVGAHWYPLRGRRVTLGLGGEMLLARDSRTAPPASGSSADGPTVSTRFSAITPQLSLNFGKRDGWSYISGGVGLAKLGAERADAPFAADPDRVRALNYGGGARWFSRPHLAFSFDVRFYTVNAQPAAAPRPAYPRSKMMVISAGVSMR